MFLGFATNRAIPVTPGAPSISGAVQTAVITSLGAASFDLTFTATTGNMLVGMVWRDASATVTMPIAMAWNQTGTPAAMTIVESALRLENTGRAGVTVAKLTGAVTGAKTLRITSQPGGFGKAVVFFANIGAAWSGTVSASSSNASQIIGSTLDVPAITTAHDDCLGVAFMGAIHGGILPVTLSDPSGGKTWTQVASGATGTLADTETCAVMATVPLPTSGTEIDCRAVFASSTNDFAGAILALAP